MTSRFRAGAFLPGLAIIVSLTSAPAFGQASKPPATPAKAAPAAKAPPAKHTLDTQLVSKPWKGDFDGMVKRRMVRILVPYSKTLYFIDKGLQRGTAYEAGVKLEEVLNKKLRTSIANKIHVVFIPTSREALADGLLQGRGDIIVAGVTVTPERARVVDFTIPTLKGVDEIVVTGPGAPHVAAVADLAGQTVAVRDKSIQFESLTKLNDTFKQQGKAPIAIRTVPTTLEDEDILEMCNAGLLKIVIVDDVLGKFWKQILSDITPHDDVKVREDGDYAWAVRKGSPKLLAELNPFIKANGQGTAFGNVILRKYLQNTQFVKSATSEADLKRFRDQIAIFQKYGAQYNVDFLLMMAQGFQESRLDQTVKSQVGAVGVMQVMPATGKDMNVGDITQMDPNINAGVKYIRFMIDQYYKDEPMDDLNKGLFAFASYNAGPARIRGLRKLAAQRGLNPNIWFNNVERVVAEKIGRETTTYVSNIYKYYVAYSLTMQELQEKQKVKAGATGGQER
jgi:membrane-bound lytic murein transglycosylase MltF